MADFCTVADVEQFLQITVSTAAQHTSMERAIAAATAAIKDYCGQQIEEVEDDEVTFDGPAACSKLFLPELPVTEVVEVIEDDEVLVEDDDYKLGAYGILHRIGGNWSAGIQNITVTYSHGYASIPATVAEVCARAASRAYQAGLRAEENEGVPGVTAKSLGDYNVSFASEGSEGTLGASSAPLLLKSEKDALNKYRYVPV